MTGKSRNVFVYSTILLGCATLCLLFYVSTKAGKFVSQRPVEPVDGRYVLTGVVKKTTRPEPEIPYDYTLIVPSGYKDSLNAYGAPSGVYYWVVVVPKTSGIRKVLESNIGRTITLEGRMEWGLAESRYLVVDEWLP